MECSKTTEEVLLMIEEGNESDLKVHVRSCPKCRQAVDKIKLVEKSLKTIQFSEPDSQYFERMANLAVDRAFQSRFRVREILSKSAVAAVISFLIIAVGVKFENNSVKPDESSLLSELKRNPTLLDSVLVDSAEINEIILAMAVQKTSKLTQKQLQQAFDQEERVK